MAPLHHGHHGHARAVRLVNRKVARERVNDIIDKAVRDAVAAERQRQALAKHVDELAIWPAPTLGGPDHVR